MFSAYNLSTFLLFIETPTELCVTSRGPAIDLCVTSALSAKNFACKEQWSTQNICSEYIQSDVKTKPKRTKTLL